MTRAEVLLEIKRAEDGAKALVAQASETKIRKISEAQAQSRDIIKSAEEETQKYAESEISKARQLIREEREKILAVGTKEAEEIKNKAKKNVKKATEFILKEFERAVNA